MKKILENSEINIIGDIDILSEDIKKELMKYKNNEKKYVLNIAYAYDYYKDILNEKNKDNENYNRKQSNIDLIIRSGGEKRLSGFFPTKTIYSELFFIDKLWLDINVYDIIDILIDYKKRIEDLENKNYYLFFLNINRNINRNRNRNINININIMKLQNIVLNQIIKEENY